jgi:hypothetical protein
MKPKSESDLFRLLHPIHEGHRAYRFLSTTIIQAKLYGELAKHRNCTFYDSKGVPRAWIRDGYIYVNVNYAWNGCSPKKYIGWPPLGKWVGTPDFAATIIPSLIHDVLYQFAKLGTYTFHQANWQFYQMMLDRDFALAEHYYDAVETFGYKYWGKDPEKLTVEYEN